MGSHISGPSGPGSGKVPEEDRASQATASGKRLGIDPLPCPFLMENHDQAYHIWQSAGLRQKILIHIDAHDDLLWEPDLDSMNIANFISQALKTDLVREVLWVVPDQTWKTRGGRKFLQHRVKKIIKGYPKAQQETIRAGMDRVSTRVLGKPLHVCSLNDLPKFTESVLLDIDVDFLVISDASSQHHHAPLPWCWPENLVAKLKAAGVLAEVVTIAYSVEGGYTPLKWKYLGDELALRLRDPGGDNAGLLGMESMRTAALAAYKGEFNTAEENYLNAKALLADSAAVDFHLAQLYADLNRNDQARACYQRAWELDPSYRTPYNSAGFWFYAERQFAAAEREHRRVLTLDPENHYALLGLGQLACRRKRWREAEVWLRKSLAHNSHLVDAHRGLGEVLAKQGRRREAIQAYETSLKLALAGHNPLVAPILSNPQDHRLLDPDHFYIHTRLARLYDLEGETDTAIIGYRMGIAKGCDGFTPRLLLARLYLKQQQWRRAGQETWRALRNLPAALRKTGCRYRYRLKQALKDARRTLAELGQ